MVLPNVQKTTAFALPLILILYMSDTRADETELDPQELLSIIKTQQQQLDQQQKTLEAQGALLKQLEQKVQTLTAPVVAPAMAQSIPEGTPDLAVEPVLKDMEIEDEIPEWPGSFGILDSETRFLLSGYVQLDAMIDDGVIGSPCDFNTGTIPTDGGTNAQGRQGETYYCVNTSRLSLSSQTPTSFGLLNTFFSVDLYGSNVSTTPELRMREVYGELNDAFWGGDLLIGQTWSTYADLEAWPDVLDFQGPGSAIAVRQPMIRWTKPVADDLTFQIALEQSGGGSVQDASMLSKWPDLVTTLKWTNDDGFLRIAGILRDIRASENDDPVANAPGWGFAGSGRIALPLDSFLLFEMTYGKGVGAYYNDGPINGVYNPDPADIDLVGVYGYYAGLNHNWTPELSSSFLFSAQNAQTLDSQPQTAGEKTAYYSVNLIWRPANSMMFGAEFIKGGRRDISGAEGKASRIQLSSRFSF